MFYALKKKILCVSCKQDAYHAFLTNDKKYFSLQSAASSNIHHKVYFYENLYTNTYSSLSVHTQVHQHLIATHRVWNPNLIPDLLIFGEYID